MNLGAILKAAGSGALKSLPLGGVVVDVAEVVLDEIFDKETVTGDEVKAKLEKLPTTVKDKVLSKTLNADSHLLASWDELSDVVNVTADENATLRKVITIAVVITLLAIGLMFSAMLGWNYITTGTLPDTESMLAAFAIPTIAIMAVFGVDNKAFTGVLLALVTRQLSKRVADKK